MRFVLLDAVTRHDDRSLSAVKLVSAAEEYLQDHFPSFPVLPGVLMLEALVQAARDLTRRLGMPDQPLVLGSVHALKFGQFVPPGSVLSLHVQLIRTAPDGSAEFRGTATVDDAGQTRTAASGRFSLRPVRTDPPDHRPLQSAHDPQPRHTPQ